MINDCDWVTAYKWDALLASDSIDSKFMHSWGFARKHNGNMQVFFTTASSSSLVDKIGSEKNFIQMLALPAFLKCNGH